MLPTRSDYDRYIALLNDTGVVYSTWQSSVRRTKGVTLSAGDKGVNGYSRLITEIHFDPTGKFLEFKLLE